MPERGELAKAATGATMFMIKWQLYEFWKKFDTLVDFVSY